MKKLLITTLQASTLIGAAALLGCDQDKSGMNTFFGPEDETRRVTRAANAQADAGAREDATLQPVHFTGGRLNSLGAEKLARMVPDDAQDDVTVYLNLPDAEVTASRKDAVGQYFKACGVDDARLKIQLGNNPDLSTPSAIGLAGLAKTQTGGAESADQAAAPSMGSGGSGGSGSSGSMR